MTAHWKGCALPGCIIQPTCRSELNMDRRTFLLQSGQLLAVAGLAPSMFGENPMPELNQHRPLRFSNDWIECTVVTAVRDKLLEDAVVVNLSTTALHYRAGRADGIILPRKSTI